MDEIIQDWEKNYYTELWLFIILVVTLIISLKKRSLHPQLKLLPIYLISFLLLNVSGYIHDIFFYQKTYSTFFLTINKIGNYLVTLIEFSTFLYYFYTIIKTTKIKIIIRIVSVCMLLLFSLILIQLLFFTDGSDYSPLHNLYIAESATLFIICFFYFIELFRSPPILKLTNTPNFWISSGLMFYLLGTLPITLITDYIFDTNFFLYENLFSIIYLLYILLFLMIIRAYLCKSEKTIY